MRSNKLTCAFAAIASLGLARSGHAADTYYEVWRNTTNDSSSAQVIPQAQWLQTTQYDDATAIPCQNYYYWVKVITAETVYDGRMNTGYYKLYLWVTVPVSAHRDYASPIRYRVRLENDELAPQTGSLDCGLYEDDGIFGYQAMSTWSEYLQFWHPTYDMTWTKTIQLSAYESDNRAEVLGHATFPPCNGSAYCKAITPTAYVDLRTSFDSAPSWGNCYSDVGGNHLAWNAASGNSNFSGAVSLSSFVGTPTNQQANPVAISAGDCSTLSATPGPGGDTVDWFTGSCGATYQGSGNLNVCPSTTTKYYARTRYSPNGCVGGSGCPQVTVTVNSSPKYIYSGCVTSTGLGTSDPWSAINPTTQFYYAEDPTHLCMRIELQDVYKNLDYSPWIHAECKLYRPDGSYYSYVYWDPAPPPSGYWSYNILHLDEGWFISHNYRFDYWPGRWTYEIYIDDGEGSGPQLVDVKYFDILEHAPLKATNPSPTNGATQQAITTSLSWSNGGRATSYDVYFGTNPSPGSSEFKGNQPGTPFNPGTLDYSTTYYWRIDSHNTGGTTPGDVWQFTTQPLPPPAKATNPQPAHLATNQSVTVTLAWTNGGGATSYDVYFGTNLSPGSAEFKGNQTSATYAPPTLAYSAPYYWRIDSRNSAGVTTGDVWQFTTYPPPPGKATSPQPAHLAINQPMTTALGWTNGGGATSYDVYFGKNPSPGSAEFKVNQPGTTYSPGPLEYSATYYWRIDSRNMAGTTPGDVWQFTTLNVLANCPAGVIFCDKFDTYFTGTCNAPYCGCTSDYAAFAAAGWGIVPGAPAYTDGVLASEYLFKTCGDPTGPTFDGHSPPFAWRQTKLEPNKVVRSLIPGIVAASGNPNMNAVNATPNSDIVITFHLSLSNVGKQDRTSAWLQLFAGPPAVMDAPVSAPGVGTCTHNPSGTATCTGGICVGGPSVNRPCTADSQCNSTCVGGPMDGQGCITNDTCIAMKLNTTGSPTTCVLLDSTPVNPRPAIAYGVYGGENGLVPKPPCTNLANRFLTHPVIYDGSNWSQMKNASPPGSSGDEFGNGMGDNTITITIHPTTIDVTASYWPTLDATCSSTTHLCSGGPNNGLACTGKSDCQPYYVKTKTGIPRKYTGPFQSIAIGAGPVYDGVPTMITMPYYGSQYSAHFDDIQISGGEFLQVPIGACCQASDSSCVEAPQAACAQMTGHTYLGDGTTCATVACESGACCLQNGTCFNTDPGTCSAQGGSYSGNGTQCSDANLACCPHGTYVWADHDADGDVDMDDFGIFQRCYTGSAATGVTGMCRCFDRNDDNRIDTTDFDAFKGCVSGPNIPANPSCGN